MRWFFSLYVHHNLFVKRNHNYSKGHVRVSRTAKSLSAGSDRKAGWFWWTHWWWVGVSRRVTHTVIKAPGWLVCHCAAFGRSMVVPVYVGKGNIDGETGQYRGHLMTLLGAIPAALKWFLNVLVDRRWLGSHCRFRAGLRCKGLSYKVHVILLWPHRRSSWL